MPEAKNPAQNITHQHLAHLFGISLLIVPKMTVVVRSVEVESLLIGPQHVLEVDRPNDVLDPAAAVCGAASEPGCSLPSRK